MYIYIYIYMYTPAAMHHCINISVCYCRRLSLCTRWSAAWSRTAGAESLPLGLRAVLWGLGPCSRAESLARAVQRQLSHYVSSTSIIISGVIPMVMAMVMTMVMIVMSALFLFVCRYSYYA